MSGENGARGIVDLSGTGTQADLTVDVCIVGSGSAGATAAWELAAAGREVVVLEEGGDFTGFALTQRDGEMYDQLYMDRAGRSTADMGITVLQGRVLGGGGVINVCDVVPMLPATIRHWRKSFGLSVFTDEVMADAQARALADLHANRPDEALLSENNRILRRGADAMGWRGEVMLHNRVGCAGLGTCLLGCPLNAKKNPRFVAIPAAIEAGARFFTRARVVRIDDAGAELKAVRVRRLDPRGYREGEGFTIHSRTVVLAANAIGSTQLLLRSGLGNEHVGRHVSLQPQLPVTAIFDEPVNAFRGIPQAFAITEFEREDDPEHGWWGHRIEAISGTPGIVASILPALGLQGKDMMAQYPNMASVLCLTPDEPVGRVEVERSGRLRIHYALTEENKVRLRESAKATARAYLAAGARAVLVPTTPPVVVRSEGDFAKIDALAFLPATTPFLSAHQQGGVRMAPSPSQGAASPEGLVYGTRGVYALDSAGYPSSASSHTMAPIIATSRLLARNLA